MVHRHAIPKQKPIAWQPSTGNRGHEVSTKWFLSLERRDNVAKLLILFFGHASLVLIIGFQIMLTKDSQSIIFPFLFFFLSFPLAVAYQPGSREV